MRQRGHQIVFATHIEYQPKIVALGLEFHRLRPDATVVDDPQSVAKMMDLKTGSEYILRKWLLPSLSDYGHDQPDNAARAARLGTSRTIPRQQ